MRRGNGDHVDHHIRVGNANPCLDGVRFSRRRGLRHLALVEKGVDMTFGDVLIFLFIAGCVIGIAFAGAMVVGGLICAGVFLARLISRKMPEIWERIP